MGASKHIDSSTALSTWSPWSSSRLVAQGLQIGGTSPTPSLSEANRAVKAAW